jgi:glycosyltransferase involved in cell wall biosynthesis
LVLIKTAVAYFPKKQIKRDENLEILVTGTFFSDNWIISLLRPLALSKRCKRIRMVSSTPVPIIEKVEPVYPPGTLSKVIGKSPARIAMFLWVGFKSRPHIIGGLHLLINGLAAILLAKLTGTVALYNCCGGPAECEGGGVNGENHLFSKLRRPDAVVERFLLQAVNASDLVITRGNLAIKYFQEHNIKTQFHVIPGGMDGNKFCPSRSPAKYDLIIVGNLIPRKRVDIFLHIVSMVHVSHPGIKAVVLGDGPLRESLEFKAKELNLKESVFFAGHQSNVDQWLRLAKIFVLTSETEGLSQAMIQAMLCGLPAVATHVGEAEELIQHGKNGFLIKDMIVDDFVYAINQLIENQTMLQSFSISARKSAERCDVHFLAKKWDAIFEELK